MMAKKVKNPPTPGAMQSTDERKKREEDYIKGCAIVKMLNPRIDSTDPMRPKQVGPTFKHVIDNSRAWEDFLRFRHTMTAQMVEVLQLPEGWITLEEWEAKQKKLLAEYKKAKAKQDAEPRV